MLDHNGLYFFLSFLVTFLFTKFIIKKSKNINLIAHPNHRKLHLKKTPVIGGISILFSLFIIILGHHIFIHDIIYEGHNL